MIHFPMIAVVMETLRYSFKGIGSFAEADKIEFFADHTYLKGDDDKWVASADRAKIENMDTMVCRRHWQGIVCDWRINEVRTSSTWKEACHIKRKKNGKNIERCSTKVTKKKCDALKAGTWGATKECKKVISNPNGFVYDSFGSYYLVKSTEECSITCPSTAPSDTPLPTNDPVEEEKVWGCYRGGKCKNTHGCCDCSIKTEKDCDESKGDSTLTPIWSSGCKGICKKD